MAGIRISGLSSGLPPNLVDQVIEAERAPVKKMQDDKAKIEDKVKLVTDFETKVNDVTKNLNNLMGRKGFVDKKLDSNLPDVVNGTLDPDVAEAGNWNLEVVQLASKASVVSAGFPDKDKTQAGVGYIRFDTPEGDKDIYISSSEESTLEKIAEKINMSSVGVKAAVVNDVNNKDRGYKLELSSEKTGEDENIKFPTVYLLDGDEDFMFTSRNEPRNAKYKLDGHEFESKENVIKDALPGITIDLKQAKPGQEIRLNIAENYDAIAEKVKGFVDSYNTALKFIQGQSKLSPDAEGRQRLGPLGGESMTRMAENRLREIIQNPVVSGSSISRINELGVEYSREGSLTFNADKLKKQINTDPKNVVQFLRGNNIDTGFITTMNNKIKALTNPTTGAIGAKKQNFQSRSRQIDERIDRKERMLEKKEASLRRQFAQMEEAMSKMQGQTAGMVKG